MEHCNYMLEDAEWDAPELLQNQLFGGNLFKQGPEFIMPDISLPKQRQFSANLESQKKTNKEIKTLTNFAKGTTNSAFTFQGGVIIAVDSVASMGEYCSSQRVDKFIRITNRLAGTMAGGAADCLFWEENLGRMVREYELKYGEQMSVASASQLFSNMMYSNRGKGLSIGSLVGGSDKYGTHLYYCDNDGNRIKGDSFTCGSGGTFAQAILDSYRRWDMSVEEAIELGRRSIAEATHMDAGSGGFCQVLHFTNEGWTQVIMADCNNDTIWNRIKQREAQAKSKSSKIEEED